MMPGGFPLALVAGAIFTGFAPELHHGAHASRACNSARDTSPNRFLNFSAQPREQK